ncbi:MAG: hypothetical protein R3A47_11535 [Polyangiales bacterium]
MGSWHALYNDGAGLDSDYQSDIDRVQGITKYKAYLFWRVVDFPNQGITRQHRISCIGSI